MAAEPKEEPSAAAPAPETDQDADKENEEANESKGLSKHFQNLLGTTRTDLLVPFPAVA